MEEKERHRQKGLRALAVAGTRHEMSLRLLVSPASFGSAIFGLIIFCAAVGIALIGLTHVALAHAAAFTVADSKDGKTIMLLDGKIDYLDSEKLDLYAIAFDMEKRGVSALYLNSPVGGLGGTARMVEVVKRYKISAVVPDSAKCASACFMAFAAGHEKDGSETDATRSLTFETVKIVNEFGVPPAIVGKFVLTPPHRMAWLSADDLRSMNVTIADTLRWPVAESGGKPDGPNRPCSASFPVEKVDPSAAATTFDGRPVRVIRWNPCKSNTDVWFGTDPLGTPHAAPEADGWWGRKRPTGKGH